MNKITSYNLKSGFIFACVEQKNRRRFNGIIVYSMINLKK